MKCTQTVRFHRAILLLVLMGMPQLHAPLRAQGLIEEVRLLIPVGTVMPFAGVDLPPAQTNAWMICDGRELKRAQYPELFAAVQYTYGGEGEVFRLPDLRGRVPVGRDDMGAQGAGNRITATGRQKHGLDGAKLGGVGGAESHTLSEHEMPPHTHNYNRTVSEGGNPIYEHDKFESGRNRGLWYGPATPTAPAGAGHPHPNLPPSIVLNYIIRVTASNGSLRVP